MPADNQFRHQSYSQPVRPDQWHIVEPGTRSDSTSTQFDSRCRAAFRPLHDQGVRSVYLVHGTLAGTDLTGFSREIGRLAPQFGSQMRTVWKQLIDMFTGDMCNYTQAFANRFNRSIQDRPSNGDSHSNSHKELVQRFLWTSENHHLGRAEAALRLILELSSAHTGDGRVMLWGHSHAGNVFAIMTNLLGGNQEIRKRFFSTLDPIKSRIDDDLWQRSKSLLLQSSAGKKLNGTTLVDPKQLDIVTFGTPIRYGWETRGYGRLLHVVNHRTLPGLAPGTVPFPPTAAQISRAEAGDYFQQFFIAGTNFVPSIYSLRKWKTERRLHELLQKEVSSKHLVDSLRQGRRLADEGVNLFIDYAASGDTAAATLSGHAVYTRMAWLPFHLELVGRYLQPIAC